MLADLIDGILGEGDELNSKDRDLSLYVVMHCLRA